MRLTLTTKAGHGFHGQHGLNCGIKKSVSSVRSVADFMSLPSTLAARQRVRLLNEVVAAPFVIRGDRPPVGLGGGGSLSGGLTRFSLPADQIVMRRKELQTMPLEIGEALEFVHLHEGGQL